jgi:hypothetical protein
LDNPFLSRTDFLTVPMFSEMLVVGVSVVVG